MTLLHWEITFRTNLGEFIAQRTVQVDGNQEAAVAQAKEDWPEFADSHTIEAYLLCEVDEDGCHAADGQRLLTAVEHRAALEREAGTLERNV